MCDAGFCTIEKNTRSCNECIFLPSVDRARTLQTTSFVSLCAEVGNCSRPIREFRSRLGAISLDTNAVASEIFLSPFLPYFNKTKTEGTNRTNERTNERDSSMKKISLFLVSLVCEWWTNSRRAVSVRDNQAFCRPAKRNELTSRTAIIAAKNEGKERTRLSANGDPLKVDEICK